MKLLYDKIALIGYGRIGQAIKAYLTEQGYTVDAFDIKEQPGVTYINPGDQTVNYFKDLLEPYDGVIAATPFHLNTMIAKAAIDTNKSYFDMTEDVNVAFEIKRTTNLQRMKNTDGKHVWVVPQCGLAPGAVSMIARKLVDKFVEVEDVNMRVGALPMTANNKMKYYLTWSSEGLINEYCNPCNAVVNDQWTTVQPLEGYEEIVIDGIEYEAFNTSGGVGSFIDTLTHSASRKAKNINYKTIRYKGHRDLMHFLLDDLDLRNNQSVLVNIFNREVPHVRDDVIVMFVQVTGRDVSGHLTAETYCRKIYGDGRFTAIQRTTASGICTVVHHWATEAVEPGLFFRTPEDLLIVENNPFWKVYEV